MKKIVKLTESDLTNIVKRIIKENAAKDSVIDMLKNDGLRYTTELVGSFKNIKKIKLDSLSNINLVQLIKDYKELYDINEHFMNTINKVTNNLKMFIKRRFSNYFNFTQINEFLLTNHTEKELDNMIYEVLNMVPDMAENRKIVPFKQILVDIFKLFIYSLTKK